MKTRIFSLLATLLIFTELSAGQLDTMVAQQEPLEQQSLNFEKLGALSYPGKILNSVCGYAAAGREYALVGTDQGLSIVDVSDPANPSQIRFVPLVNSIWRDVKTYRHYAYVVHGAYNGMEFDSQAIEPDGVVIIELNTITSSELSVHKWKVPGVYETAHNIHIDEEKGIAFLFGIQERKGALMLDIATDPIHPKVLGEYNGSRTSDLYIHDGTVSGDLMYGCADKRGVFMVVDISRPDKPKEITSVATPNRMTHNAWLSKDAKVLFTTDEKVSAFITAFDITDLKNVKMLGKIRTRNFEDAIPHNAVVMGDFIFTSYYSQGVRLFDATYPENMLEVGFYRTTETGGGQFDGAWGVYPYLPSGNVLVSDTGTGLHIIRPSFHKAAYIRGVVKDDKGQPVYNAEVTSSDGQDVVYTDFDGAFKTAHLQQGVYTYSVSAGESYSSERVDLDLKSGQITECEVILRKHSDENKQLMETYVKVYPNPFYEDRLLNVEYSFKEGIQGSAYLMMLDITGREVYREELKTNEGVILVGKELPKGIYFVKIFNGTSYSRVIKVIKS